MGRDRNVERAKRAYETLSYYKERELEEAGPVDQDTLVDLLTDLFHVNKPALWNSKFDMHAAIRMAKSNYNAEILGEDDL